MPDPAAKSTRSFCKNHNLPPMPAITLHTFIQAPAGICFDLARSIDLHQDSVAHTREKAIAGRRTGLAGAGDTVTWEAVHFGVRQRFTGKITEVTYPVHFRDVMLKGIFKKLEHDHHFREEKGGTLMTDIFIFKAPLGIFGKLAERLFLTAYLRNFLIRRNAFIRQVAESGDYRKHLPVS